MSNINLLQLYVESGVDEVISEVPINRLARKISEQPIIKTAAEALPANIKTVLVVPSHSGFFDKTISTFNAISKLAKKQKPEIEQIENSQPLISIKKIISQAKEMAEESQTLDDLKKAVENFDGCSLKKMATNTVFADGDPTSQIMIIGEAPGNNEDLQGIPFCGDSGKLLNEMFKAIGFKRENLYITNTLFWRPPGNRRPTEDELAMCKPFVEKHIALMQPKLIVLMGATAMFDILKITDPIGKMCGKFFDYQNSYLPNPIKATVLFHPSYLMRQSSKKRDAWLDLLTIKEFLKKI